MRFGLEFGSYPSDLPAAKVCEQVVERAQVAQRNNFEALFVAQHFLTGPDAAILQSLPLLSYLAGRVPGMYVGTSIFLVAVAPSGDGRRVYVDAGQSIRRQTSLRRRPGISRKRVQILRHRSARAARPVSRECRDYPPALDRRRRDISWQVFPSRQSDDGAQAGAAFPVRRSCSAPIRSGPSPKCRRWRTTGSPAGATRRASCAKRCRSTKPRWRSRAGRTKACLFFAICASPTARGKLKIVSARATSGVICVISNGASRANATISSSMS